MYCEVVSSSGCSNNRDCTILLVPDHSKAVELIEAVVKVIVDPEDKHNLVTDTKVTDVEVAVSDTNLVRPYLKQCCG